MLQIISFRAALFVVMLSLPLLGCRAEGEATAEQVALADPAADQTEATAEAPPESTPPQNVGPVTDLPPNELGEIMVLEYHRIGDNEGEWVRSETNFRKDLRTLYEKGYRPVLMRDVVRGHIDVPAGTTPVVFTIDDSSLGQFYYRENGSLDPRTMMGMWTEFQQQNPGWHYGAVWCILPGAEHPSNFWGERPSREVPRQQREETIRRKMAHLMENRHEACNHTMWHARLDRYDDAFVQDQIGSGMDSIRAYLPPDYEIVTFALPLGMWPKNRSLAWQGTYRGGKTYRKEVVLEVSGGPNVSPFDTRFNPRSVDRFIVAPGALERQLATYERNPEGRFVSDGNPNVVSVPEGLSERLDRNRLAGREVKIVRENMADANP